MLEPKRIESTVVPQKFVNLGNGNWYYNYDIQSRTVEVPSMEEGKPSVTEVRYNYIQVKMAGKPDYKRCVELIIREHITQSQEFDLINSFSMASYNLLSEVDAQEEANKYLDYLNKLKEIKSKIKADFE